MSDLDIREWRLRRAKGAIEQYMRGLKRRASDISWVIGVLKGNFGVSKEEALSIIDAIKEDKTIILTPKRLRRLEELRRRVEQEEWGS